MYMYILYIRKYQCSFYLAFYTICAKVFTGELAMKIFFSLYLIEKYPFNRLISIYLFYLTSRLIPEESSKCLASLQNRSLFCISKHRAILQHPTQTVNSPLKQL